MEGLQNSDYSVSVDVGKSEDVRPFAFGEDDLSLMGVDYALRQVNERFARQATVYFSAYASFAAAYHTVPARGKNL